MGESHGHPLLIKAKETVPCLYQSTRPGGQKIFNDKEDEGERGSDTPLNSSNMAQELDSNYIQVACEEPRAVLPMCADSITGIFVGVFLNSARS